MRANYNWLKEWIDIEVNPEELAEMLNNLGIEVEEMEKTSADIIYNIEVTPNRPDLLSILGIVREISAKTGVQLNKKLNYKFPPVEDDERQHEVEINIESEKDCKRYIAAIIGGIEVKSSPPEIKQRLEKCGIRSINNVIDITNYVMLETGQPLHAFDYDSIEEKIIVRRARNKENILTLEEENKELSESDLVIADKNKPVAIAGVMGGKNSGIKESTRQIVLESAYFKPSLIRKTSKRLNLSTESSYRFERKADIGMLPVASAYAINLLQKHADGKLIAPVVDTNSNPETTVEVDFSPEKMNRILGLDVKDERVIEIFRNLGLKEERKNGGYIITVPSFRRDIEIEEDLIEEAGRFIGYNNIPARFEYRRKSRVKNEGTEKLSIKRIMSSLGFHEAVNVPFISKEWADKENVEPIEIENPLWKERPILRTTILPGLIENTRTNLNRGEDSVKLFETGKTFFKQKGEVKKIAAVMSGRINQKWYREEREIDFYDVKGAAEKLLERLYIKDFEFIDCKSSLFRKEAALTISLKNTIIGHLGLIIQNACKVDIYGMEMDIHKLINLTSGQIKYRNIYRYPPIKRDLSLVVDEDMNYSKISNLIDRGLEYNLKTELIDIYRGKSIEEGKKSITIRLEIYHPDKTLTEEDIEDDLQNILEDLSREGVYLRR